VKWQPKDIVAILVIGVAAALLFKGINGTVAWSLVAIIAGYYGIDFAPFIKWGRNQKGKKEE